MDWEERTFNGLSDTYRLSYGYNLAGQLTSLAEPSQFGATVNYAYDSAGRLGSVSATGMQVASLMSGLQYRASGALKHANYGDGTNLNLSYNNRQLLTRYELNNVKDLTAWPYPYTTMGSQNQYHADGRVQYTQDLRNGNFDRGYTFDHAGQLEIATSGREARGEPPANPADSPYKQTFSYDAWGNMGRVARLWTNGQSDNPTYTNNRRSDWAYDAEGNAIQGGWAPSQTHTYDAAGKQVNLYEESWSGPPEFWTFHQNTIAQVYSGGGQQGKRIETRHSEDYQGTITNDVKTVYFLKSSVLGGATILEIDQWGQREGHVYAGGEKIADYHGWAPNGWMDFRHTNRANGNWVSIHLPGNGGTRTEFDPLGATVGVVDPFPSQLSYNDMVGNDFLYAELGNPFDLGSGCGRLDGMPISCSERQRRMGAGNVTQEVTRNHGERFFVPIQDYGLGMFGLVQPDPLKRLSDVNGLGVTDILSSDSAPQEPAKPSHSKRDPCATPNNIVELFKKVFEAQWERTMKSGEENGSLVFYDPAKNTYPLVALSEGWHIREGKTQYAPNLPALPNIGPETAKAKADHPGAYFMVVFHTHPNWVSGESAPGNPSPDDIDYQRQHENVLGIIRTGNGYSFFSNGKRFGPNDAKANECIWELNRRRN